MTIKEMKVIIDEIKPEIQEKYSISDLQYDIQEIEGDNFFYKCVTNVDGVIKFIHIRIDINEAFVKKAFNMHIKTMINEVWGNKRRN